jgi:hypothetical protein
MLHCGANAINRAELYGVLPIHGALGARHNPVPYGEFVDLVTENLQHAGYRIKEESYGVLADGNRFFGLLELEPAALPAGRVLEGEYIAAKDWALTVGLRGSYDQTLPRGLAVGSRVFVCDNQAFSGEVVMQTKQTTHIRDRLPRLVGQAVQQVGGLERAQDLRFETYRETPLHKRHGDAAIIELVRRQAINPSQVGRVVAEWDTPSHEEHLHAAKGRTVWTLHNAVTEALKPPADSGRPNVLPTQARTIAMTKFLDEVVGIEF